jgi:predicted transcriptional regulator YdeE
MAEHSKPVVVDLPLTQLVVVRADSDNPDAIKAAWQQLEARLTSLRGRRFYGVCYEGGAREGYYAGLEPVNEQEGTRLGFEPLTVDAGKFVRLSIKDWQAKIAEIPQLVDMLRRDFVTDPARPTIEFYRSQTELHLLVPLRES